MLWMYPTFNRIARVLSSAEPDCSAWRSNVTGRRACSCSTNWNYSMTARRWRCSDSCLTGGRRIFTSRSPAGRFQHRSISPHRCLPATAKFFPRMTCGSRGRISCSCWGPGRRGAKSLRHGANRADGRSPCVCSKTSGSAKRAKNRLTARTSRTTGWNRDLCEAFPKPNATCCWMRACSIGSMPACWTQYWRPSTSSGNWKQSRRWRDCSSLCTARHRTAFACTR